MRWSLPLLIVALAGLVRGASGADAAPDDTNAVDQAHAPLVREIEPFSAVIMVRNPNDRAVKVKLLDPTCTCAALDMPDKFILPKAAVPLRIVVDNRNRSGEQHIGVSVFLTDPDAEAIEVTARWNVRACVQVDGIAPGADPAGRPADTAWRDVYRYVAKARPDELRRLRKRVRISCAPEEAPPGGFKVEGIDYAGTLWSFAQTIQADGSVLLTATARDPDGTAPEGDLDEVAVVRTNHPDKARIELHFVSIISKNAGERQVDPQDPLGGAPGGLPPIPGLPGPPGK